MRHLTLWERLFFLLLGGWLLAALLILTLIEIAILVLIALPSSRRAYR